MQSSARSDAKGILAIAWRSIVYFPLALRITGLLLLVITALLYLPMVAIVFTCYGLFSWAAAAVLLWLTILWLWRRFRLGRLLIGS